MCLLDNYIISFQIFASSHTLPVPIFNKIILSISYNRFLTANTEWSVAHEKAIIYVPTVLRYLPIGSHTINFSQAFPGPIVIT